MTESSQARDIVLGMIQEWGASLVNLTRASRLLNFKVSGSSTLQFRVGDMELFLERLLDDELLRFSFRQTESPAQDTLPSEIDDPDLGLPSEAYQTRDGDLVCKESLPVGERVLRTLQRKARDVYLNTGLSILYVSVGLLKWVDVDGTQNVSPIVLIPVQFVSAGAKNPPLLRIGEDDVVVNPALLLKLREFGVELADLDEDSVESILNVIENAKNVTQSKAGWEVTDDFYLSHFTFHKEAMYRDLMDNADAIADHPLVQTLALSGTRHQSYDAVFDPIDHTDIDTLAPPEWDPVVLDADSSQRACIAAALDGKSFVIDGPPGTGKSQTIANVIAGLLHQGKTVLFVSEKIAALEVVKNRLEDVGLDSYTLELHSHKTRRKEFAQSLGHKLTHQPVTPSGMAVNSLRRAETRRKELTQYAIAMNESREPLGITLHQAIGWLSRWVSVPDAPAVPVAVETFSAEDFGQIVEASERIAGAWRPAFMGPNYVWLGVKQGAAVLNDVVQAQRSLRHLVAVLEPVRSPAEELGLYRLTRLSRIPVVLEKLKQRDERTPLEWLATEDLGALGKVRDTLGSAQTRLASAEESVALVTPVLGLASPGLPSLDASEKFWSGESATIRIDHLDLSGLHALRSALTEEAYVHARLDDGLTLLANYFGRTYPRTDVEFSNLILLGRFATDLSQPPGICLSDEGLANAKRSLEHLRTALDSESKAGSIAQRTYTTRALDADAVTLQSKFTNVHRGFHKLTRDFRDDMNSLRAVSLPGLSDSDMVSGLADLIAWQESVAARVACESSYATSLGYLYEGPQTQWDRVERAIQIAEWALSITAPDALPALRSYLAAEASLPENFSALVEACSSDLQRRKEGAPNDLLAGQRVLINQQAISETKSWLESAVRALDDIIRVQNHYAGATGLQMPWSSTRDLLQLVQNVESARRELDDELNRWSREIEPWRDGAQIHLEEFGRAIQWIEDVRKTATGSDHRLTDSQLTAVTSLSPVLGFDDARADWTRWSDRVLDGFETYRQPSLREAFDNLDDANALLEDLLQDSAGQDEWHTYSRARAELLRLGADEVLRYAALEQLDEAVLARSIQKAFITGWVNRILSSDERLDTVRGPDRDALVKEFRKLDAEIVELGAASIIEVLNDRRPTLAAGQTGIIRAEADRERGHMPVRELIRRAQDAIRAISPCFMMSPLAVSNFLPSDLKFDVVIFDEASQVEPADAINCIYRGNALIIAGDQKQLPPTNFFEISSESDDDDEWDEDESSAGDFRSVLDIAKGSGALTAMTLRWHYRSRHEDLISFSNQSFYQGELITFPSAIHTSENHGVEFFKVDGVYGRGTSRNNLIEARAVAERVVHHFDTRPNLSLGVVALSDSQADAIEQAVDEMRVHRPDLDRHFGEDRLGDFFVKNLESVQGDERDVMILSIGYGRDQHGRMHNNFGPLNSDGGWRRLNVAVTRARYRLEVVSSIDASDISSVKPSVLHLRNYLDFAARGASALGVADAVSLGGTESPFEDSVMDVIRSLGYVVEPQIGSAGYRIDLGVRHPEHPGAWMLGIECDGYMYHSSRAARDRDRLRQQVLEGLGWKLHRIWGTAWYRNRDVEISRLTTALESAALRPVLGVLSDGPRQRPTVVQVEEIELFEDPDWTVPYKRTFVSRPPTWLDLSQPGAHDHMVAPILQIVNLEAPIHRDLLEARLRDTWGVRIGSRISANIDAAIRKANIIQDGDFLLTHKEDDFEYVRVPGDDVPRPINQIHRTELEAAILGLARDAVGISRHELMSRTKTLFGWRRMGSEIEARLASTIDELIQEGYLLGDLERITYSGIDD